MNPVETKGRGIRLIMVGTLLVGAATGLVRVRSCAREVRARDRGDAPVASAHADPELASTSKLVVRVPELMPAALVASVVDPYRDDARPLVGEESTMQQIRQNVKISPQLAETLARELREQGPNSPHADERDAYVVAALYNQRRMAEVRAEGHYYLVHHPNGQWAEYVKGLMRVRSER